MSIKSDIQATTVENIHGKARYTFNRVNMANLPAQLTPGGVMAKAGNGLRMSFRLGLFAIALGVGVLVRQIGGDYILAAFVAGATAFMGLLFATIISDQPERDVVVTVSDSGVTVQRSPHLLMAPASVPQRDILTVMLTPSYPGTFTAEGPVSAMRPSSAIVLQRRSMAPYVLISGCAPEDLAPLAQYIAGRFKLTMANAGNPPTPTSPIIIPSLNTEMRQPLQRETPHTTQPHIQPIDRLCYPSDHPDRRVTTTQRDGTLLIKVRRTSTFWQPVTLVAVVLIEAPILALAFALGAFAINGMMVDRLGQYVGPGFWNSAAMLGIASLVLLATVLAATKGVVIIAKPQGLAAFTTFLWRRHPLSVEAGEIAAFGVHEFIVPGTFIYSGSVTFHELVVETKSRDMRRLLCTTRLSQQQVGALATQLRRFYGV